MITKTEAEIDKILKQRRRERVKQIADLDTGSGMTRAHAEAFIKSRIEHLKSKRNLTDAERDLLKQIEEGRSNDD